MMAPSASLRLRSLSVRLAGHALAIIEDIAQACRLAQSVNFHRRALSQEHPRVVVSIVSAAYLAVRVQGQCLLLREQWSTDPWTRASKNLGQIIQGEGA